MHIEINRTAEIAFRSLGDTDQRKILRAFATLDALSPKDLFRDPKLYKVRTASGEKLYVYRGSDKLRIVLSVHEDTCTVVDILSQDRLQKLLPNGERP